MSRAAWRIWWSRSARLGPVGLLDARRVGVQGGDRRLRLVLTEPVASERSLEHDDPLRDEVAVPPAPVLVGERDDAPVGPRAAGPAGVVQQHQGEEPVHLGVVDRRRQLPGVPDRLGRQVDVTRAQDDNA